MTSAAAAWTMVAITAASTVYSIANQPDTPSIPDYEMPDTEVADVQFEPLEDGLDDITNYEQPDFDEYLPDENFKTDDSKPADSKEQKSKLEKRKQLARNENKGRSSTLLTSPDLEDTEPNLKKKSLLGE